MILRIVVVTLLLQTTLPPGRASGTASIDGVVLRAGTSEPIEDVLVILATPGDDSFWRSVTSDGQGRFRFKDLEAGPYRLAFEKNGYPRQELEQRVFPGSGTTLQLADRQVRNLVARLTPGGAVSGRIVDEEGRPLASVPVQLLRAEYARDGGRRLAGFGGVRTDDRGEYRLYFITPGRYYLRAGAVQEAPYKRHPNALAASYKPMLHPGVVDLQSATVIEVQPGAELSGVDMTLHPEAVHRIRGRVIDAATGQFPANVELTLTYYDPILGDDYQGKLHVESGLFEFRSVVPGAYVVSALSLAPGAPVSLEGPVGTPRTILGVGSAAVDVGGADVDDLVLPIVPGASITGLVRIDGGKPLGAALVGVVTGDGQPYPPYPVGVVRLAGSQNDSRPRTPRLATGQVKRDGTFRIMNVLPGDYVPEVAGLRPTFYIKEAWFAGVDVLNQPLRVGDDTSGTLDILLGSGLGTLGGVVTSRQRPAAGAQVMLVPDRARTGTELVRQTVADRDGRFTISEIVPGEYRVFASDAVEARAWVDPRLLAREPSARLVHVAESSAQNIQLTLIAVQ